VDSLTDNQVMGQVRDGEVEKLGVLFERHHQSLFGFFVRLTGRRELSEDLVQEVFLRMLKYRHSFQPENQFRPWMFRIARNAHFDAARKRQREARISGAESEAAEGLIAPEPTPDLRVGQQQEIGFLQQALARLPVEKREVLLLSRVQNLKYEQVAEILGCDTGTVKVRVHRALKELRDIFGELTGEKRYEM
jgi:RNA polymerase sigma-70 factor (ECF subfamily)